MKRKRLTERMAALLAKWLDIAKQNRLPSQRRKKLDRKTEETLKSLGYIK